MSVRFAVTAVERSGTHWLAQVLDGAEGVNVHHEPEPLRVWDARVQGMAHDGTLDKETFVKGRYHYWLQTYPHGGARGEVNSVIRYVAAEIRDIWRIPVAAIVRDGRLTVRSLMKRQTFTRQDAPQFLPPPELRDDPFAACCWMWAESYDWLEADKIPTWRLEDLNEDRAAFVNLCAFLGIEPPLVTWKSLVGRHVARSFPVDAPLDWDSRQHEIFAYWAGEVQERWGYDGAGGMG